MHPLGVNNPRWHLNPRLFEQWGDSIKIVKIEGSIYFLVVVVFLVAFAGLAAGFLATFSTFASVFFTAPLTLAAAFLTPLAGVFFAVGAGFLTRPVATFARGLDVLAAVDFGFFSIIGSATARGLVMPDCERVPARAVPDAGAAFAAIVELRSEIKVGVCVVEVLRLVCAIQGLYHERV